MTLGILGGGQLGRMSALAGIRMGVRVKLLSPTASGPAKPFADTTVADWTDPDVLALWAADCDAVTVESEWAPADRLAEVFGGPIRPRPETLEIIRHKGRQNTALAEAGLPLPRFSCCATLDEARAAAAAFGYPVLAKRYEGSYDGYGNATCRTPEDLAHAWDDLAAEPAPAKAGGMLVEAFVDFAGEVSALVARREGGETAVYPIVATEHREHQLYAAWMPAGLSDEIEAEARRAAGEAIAAVGGIGLLAVEMFVTREGRVLVNEIAPRPHNTGHLTLEACHTSQFENHVRAALDLPLGDPSLQVPAACMVNVVGSREGPVSPRLGEAMAVPGAAVHLYGKEDSRPRRKLGHVTVTAPDAASARERAEAGVVALGL